MAAETIAIVGESGTGKSTCLRNLNPEETFLISTTGKPLPFKGYKKKYKNKSRLIDIIKKDNDFKSYKKIGLN